MVDIKNPAKPGPSFRDPSGPEAEVPVHKPPDRPAQPEEMVTDEAREREAEALRKEAEEAARKEQELADQRRALVQDIVKSNEGYLVLEDGNRDAVEEARTKGMVYVSTVQAGRGGLDIEERVFMSDSGYQMLREAFGPNLGVEKKPTATARSR